MNLSTFILENMEAILQEWEDFAKKITVHSIHVMDTKELRNHAKQMLQVIAADLHTPQDTQQSIDKSHGLAPETKDSTAAETHAVARLISGFTIEQLMAEYRALRASVLRLWGDRVKISDPAEIQDMVRFNEAIDQALTESVARYSEILRESQNLFLAILGHDVRTPLGAISMGAQFLLLDENLPVKSLKMASRILSSTKRIDEIVSDLLDFATTHLGDGIPVSPSSTDLAELCNNVVEEAATFHSERVIKLAMAGDLSVVWDRARISQAFSNLIANAIQHGSETDPVSITVTGKEKEIIWTIHNNGEVIAPEKLQTIFDPAKRFALRPAHERALAQTHNLGLGLYIAREIISAHGGRISIASSLADGTTFTIHLPRQIPAREARVNIQEHNLS
jgi:signal transduction histidine kinase